ncbi:MAG: hypothetical protein A2W85_02480 [Bacteroidetes bacterium GWF2_41_31]|nr:MAG: hypothetical protein A2W85_02480 [Bacteroidetes bacterium GWF2_41_31]
MPQKQSADNKSSEISTEITEYIKKLELQLLVLNKILLKNNSLISKNEKIQDNPDSSKSHK